MTSMRIKCDKCRDDIELDLPAGAEAVAPYRSSASNTPSELAFLNKAFAKLTKLTMPAHTALINAFYEMLCKVKRKDRTDASRVMGKHLHFARLDYNGLVSGLTPTKAQKNGIVATEAGKFYHYPCYSALLRTNQIERPAYSSVVLCSGIAKNFLMAIGYPFWLISWPLFKILGLCGRCMGCRHKKGKVGTAPPFEPFSYRNPAYRENSDVEESNYLEPEFNPEYVVARQPTYAEVDPTTGQPIYSDASPSTLATLPIYDNRQPSARRSPSLDGGDASMYALASDDGTARGTLNTQYQTFPRGKEPDRGEGGYLQVGPDAELPGSEIYDNLNGETGEMVFGFDPAISGTASAAPAPAVRAVQHATYDMAQSSSSDKEQLYALASPSRETFEGFGTADSGLYDMATPDAVYAAPSRLKTVPINCASES